MHSNLTPHLDVFTSTFDETALVCRRSRQELFYHLPALALSLVSAGMAFFFTGRFFLPWGMAVGVGFLIIVVIVATQLLRLTHYAKWGQTPQGPVLAIKTWGQRWSALVGELDEVRIMPSWGKSLVRQGHSRVILSHQLVGAEFLLEQLRVHRPELFPPPSETLQLKVSMVGLISYLGFVAGIVLAAGLLWPIGIFASGVAIAFVIFPLERLLRKTARRFEVSPAEIRVVYLIGNKSYPWVDLSDWSEDNYASGGCNFYLIKLIFGVESVVLDEGQLLTSLKTHKAWMMEHFFLPQKSLY